MDERKTTPEEAKFWRDKHVLEYGGKDPLLGQPGDRKDSAVRFLDVDPENYDKIKNNYSLEVFKEVVKDWLYIEDTEVLDIVVATIMGEKIGGDPLWLFLIAPPGGSKTELLRSFTGNYAHHLSDMTSKTFISGLMINDEKDAKKRRKVHDLLPQLNGKILIFKDFTTILEKGRDEKKEIIAQFREAYDGSFAKKVGTVDETIRYDSRFGIIAGVTPVIDDHWKVMQQLGERFLKVRWKEDTDKVTKRARENEGEEVIMREELCRNSDKFISNLNFDKIPEFDDERFGEIISKVAKFIAFARTPIKISNNPDEFYFERIPSPEMPTRLVKQLKKLSKCLALVRGKSSVTETEIKIIIRVAKDTVPPDRMAVLTVIAAFEKIILNGCPKGTICKELKIAETSVRRILEQLKRLDLIVEHKIRSNSFDEFTYHYTLGNISTNIFGTLPEKSEETKSNEKR